MSEGSVANFQIASNSGIKIIPCAVSDCKQWLAYRDDDTYFTKLVANQFCCDICHAWFCDDHRDHLKHQVFSGIKQSADVIEVPPGYRLLKCVVELCGTLMACKNDDAEATKCFACNKCHAWCCNYHRSHQNHSIQRKGK
ncbi:MAG: hypothetical protein ACMG6E_08965 [Candidatus Roizmanbacteria bacterium]